MYIDLELEIGFGKTPVFTKLAARSPQTRFIGIEIDEALCRETERRIHRLQLPNALVIHDDALQYISAKIASASVRTIHIYFPSPFPIDNRIMNDALVAQLHRCLRPQGVVRLVTDDDRYFEKIDPLFDDESWILAIWPDLHIRRPPGLIVGTGYEKKLGAKHLLYAMKKG